MSKEERLRWLARLYGSDPETVDDSEADEHLADRLNDFGMANFLTTYRPLAKLRDTHGRLEFELREIDHAEATLTYAELFRDGQPEFVLRVRFDDGPDHRIRYWSSFPPLPPEVHIRPYRPTDAADCAALDLACAMEMDDGSSWLVDRGAAFDDYLTMMGRYDAQVVVADEQIVGFYSNALRPIRLKDEFCHAAYQHHYRVHPDYRAGSVSMALASEVDSRHTFRDEAVVMPYSLIDPHNVHMGNMGFPAVPDLTVARLTLPVSGTSGSVIEQAELSEAIRLSDLTHGQRTMYPQGDRAYWEERLSRIPSYGHEQLVRNEHAMLGVWSIGERNVLRTTEGSSERRLAFALDYGFEDVDALVRLIEAYAGALAARGITHLSFLLDTRAEEYAALAARADDEQQFYLHTLPWLLEAVGAGVFYPDGVYC